MILNYNFFLLFSANRARPNSDHRSCQTENWWWIHMFEANPNWLWGFLSSSQLLQLMCLFDRTQSWQNYVQSLSYWKVQQDGQWCGTWKFQMWKMSARISRVSMEVHCERSYCGCHKLSGNYALCNNFNLVTSFWRGSLEF